MRRVVIGLLFWTLSRGTADAQPLPIAIPQRPDPLMDNLTIPADASTRGMWSTEQNWPVIAIHVLDASLFGETCIPRGYVMERCRNSSRSHRLPGRSEPLPSECRRRAQALARYTVLPMPSRENAPSEFVYYRDSGTVPLASRISLHVRRKMFALFMETMRPGPDARVLDVGVTSDERFRESNYFEQLYPYPHNITCVGTEDGSHLATRYPGLTYRQVRGGDRLPFRDGEFDIVFSNAVLEHVGSRASQAAFLRELGRVGKAFFITTPDRLFPFEHHTGLPLLHYLPPAAFRGIIAKTRYAHWSLESNLNMLTARELAALFPAEAFVDIHRIRLMRLPSNLVATGRLT